MSATNIKPAYIVYDSIRKSLAMEWRRSQAWNGDGVKHNFGIYVVLAIRRFPDSKY